MTTSVAMIIKLKLPAQWMVGFSLEGFPAGNIMLAAVNGHPDLEMAAGRIRSEANRKRPETDHHRQHDASQT
jgi:hypothetical protein